MNISERLTQERRARLAAEHLLAKKQAELSYANRKLGRHAMALTRRIGETQAEVDTVRTENEQFRSDLSEANEKVQIAERRLWLSIETIRDGFAFFASDSRMIAANESYLHIFDGLEEIRPGVSYARILQFLAEEGIINPGDLSLGEWHTMMMDRWYSPRPSPVTIQFFNGQYVRIYDQRGHGGDVVTLTHDITAMVQNELDLNAARQRAEAANRAKSAFLANMSHEIRTPMNGVVGMAELLTETELNKEQRLYAETIRNSGEALLVIINDVLDYSKIEADKLVLSSEPFDLEQCIHEVVMLLQPAARDKGLDLIVDYDLFLPTSFIGDPGRIRQTLTNLVGNAVKFTASGHVIIRVTGFGPAETGPFSVHLCVEDTGIGIPPEKVDQVFGEFNQVDDERNRQFEGTGLGLAITKRLIELMDGEIWLETEVGVGSCFGFRVPLPPVDLPDGQPDGLPQQLRRALIVTRSPESGAILNKQLSFLGLSITAVTSGQEAAKAITEEIDLVVSDLDLPDTDGLKLISELRGLGARNVPYFLLTSEPITLPADAPELSAVLQKPVYRADLVSHLRALATEVPLTIAEEQQTDTVPSEPAKVEDGRTMRVLVAEDNRTNQLVFRKMVKALTLDLRFANNGEDAVAAFPEFQPDLIFMDISMPKMDGKTATAEIRKIERDTGRKTPIVALTAHAMTGDRETILSAGLDEYLTKPLRKDELLRQINRNCPSDVASPLEAE